MKSDYLNIKYFTRFLVALCVVTAMLIPTAIQAAQVIASIGTQMPIEGHLMSMDYPEDSGSEEQKEDNSKDEKVEVRFLKTLSPIVAQLANPNMARGWVLGTDYIQEIPIPPPER